MILLPLMTDAEQVPLFVNSLPIGLVCARTVPAGTTAKITVAMNKSARPEKYGLATIAGSFSYPIRASHRIISSHPDGACGLLRRPLDSAHRPLPFRAQLFAKLPPRRA